MKSPLFFKCPDCQRIWIHSSSCNYFYIKDSTWPKVETEAPPGIAFNYRSCSETMEDPPECPKVIEFYAERRKRESSQGVPDAHFASNE